MIETHTPLESRTDAYAAPNNREEATTAAFRTWLCDRIHATLLVDLSTVSAVEGNPYANSPDDQRRLAREAAASLDAFLRSSGWIVSDR